MFILIIYIILLMFLMVFLDSIKMQLNDYLKSNFLLATYINTTTFLHELFHYIFAKMFSIKVSNFKVNNVQTSENELGSVEIADVNKSGESGVGEHIALFLTALAPIVVAFIIFTWVTDSNLLSFKDFQIGSLGFKSIITFIMTNFKTEASWIICLTFLFFLTGCCTVSLQDIKVASTSFLKIDVWIYISLIFLSKSTLGNWLYAFKMDDLNNKLLYLFLLIVVVGMVLAFLRFYSIRNILFYISALILGGIISNILFLFLLFLVVYNIALVFNIVVSFLIKTLNSKTKYY